MGWGSTQRKQRLPPVENPQEPAEQGWVPDTVSQGDGTWQIPRCLLGTLRVRACSGIFEPEAKGKIINTGPVFI